MAAPVRLHSVDDDGNIRVLVGATSLFSLTLAAAGYVRRTRRTRRQRTHRRTR